MRMGFRIVDGGGIRSRRVVVAAGSIPPSRQGSVAPSDAEMSTPTGPTTPPCSGQSADADVSMTPKASERKPTDPPQPQGSGSGPSGSGPKSSGPSRADKGKQPDRTNPVAVQPRPQPKKPVVPFQCMGMPPPINRPCDCGPIGQSRS